MKKGTVLNADISSVISRLGFRDDRRLNLHFRRYDFQYLHKRRYALSKRHINAHLTLIFLPLSPASVIPIRWLFATPDCRFPAAARALIWRLLRAYLLLCRYWIFILSLLLH
jgi:hypothetical protein